MFGLLLGCRNIECVELKRKIGPHGKTHVVYWAQFGKFGHGLINGPLCLLDYNFDHSLGKERLWVKWSFYPRDDVIVMD